MADLPEYDVLLKAGRRYARTLLEVVPVAQRDQLEAGAHEMLREFGGHLGKDAVCGAVLAGCLASSWVDLDDDQTRLFLAALAYAVTLLDPESPPIELSEME